MTELDCCSNEKAVNAPIHVAEVLTADPKNAHASQDDPEHVCAACRGENRPVTRKTMLLMLKPELFDSVGEGEYRFCSNPECRVVYFTEGEGRSFITDDLRVRVGMKEKTGLIPLCYCFGFDEADIREEIRETGHSAVPQRIAALVRERMCACPVRNPSGTCCLGEVNKAAKRLMLDLVEAGPPT